MGSSLFGGIDKLIVNQYSRMIEGGNHEGFKKTHAI